MIIATATAVAAKDSSLAPTHLCYFFKTLLPCAKLRAPISLEGFQKVNYRPTKWIPLWPKNTAFGGDDNSDAKLQPDYYNRAIPFNPMQPNIESVDLNSDIFGASFVDNELSRISSWMLPQEKYALALVDSSKVFRAPQILELWKQSLKSGLHCEQHATEYTAGPAVERFCAFTRLSSKKKIAPLEYCTYEVDVPSNIRGEMTCTVVAEISDASSKLLAARYVYYDFSGGDYAGQFRCQFDRMTLDQASDQLRNFVRQRFGASSKYFALPDEGGGFRFRAEGINVEDKEERMFVRTALSGSMSLDLRKKGRTPAVSIFLDAWFSVSAQASDDIISYREPSSAMGNRLRNHFEDTLKSFMNNGSSCWFDG
ncbi:hypothetical protein [Bradyrhizobium sp. YR681]|uniref:hypothetical protein n=1 Tax=Bradyrhizobium sp. YR681 TaxID=1144344 RepID=UPI0012F67CCA|nr:hypothetical protein [Bradyrhizobium sp. YR681]